MNTACLKNKYKNQRCFILGNGPSLNKVDLSKLSGEILFGTNRISLMYEQGLPKVDFHVVADAVWWKNHNDELKINKPKCLFLRNNVIDRCNISPDQYDFSFKIHNDPLNRSIREFDFSVGSHKGGTVVIDCIQLAAFMGFSQIYLLGTDCSYAEKRHAYQEPDVNWRPMAINTVLKSYDVVRYILDKSSVQIFNAGPGGKLEAFKRIDFNTLF